MCPGQPRAEAGVFRPWKAVMLEDILLVAQAGPEELGPVGRVGKQGPAGRPFCLGLSSPNHPSVGHAFTAQPL